MNIPKELQELRSGVDTLMAQYKEKKENLVKARQVVAQPLTNTDPQVSEPEPNEDNPIEDLRNDLEDLIYQLVGSVHQRCGYMENSMYNYMDTHAKGHLPPIQGADKMQTALKVLNLDGDYQVNKPCISAAKDKYGFQIQ
jgi:hypothetical protein